MGPPAKVQKCVGGEPNERELGVYVDGFQFP